MAYITVSAYVSTNKADLQTKLLATLVSAGWTLHDDQTALGYQVYSSPGESGLRVTEYIKITTNASSTIVFQAWGYWNTATHAGSIGVYAATTNTLTCNASTASTLWMQASKDLVYISVKYGASRSYIWFGHIPNRFWPEAAVISSPVSSGNSIVIPVTNATGDFVVGRTYQCFGGLGEGRYQVVPTAVDISGGTGTITVASLGAGLSAGSVIGSKPSAFISGTPTATTVHTTSLLGDPTTGNNLDDEAYQAMQNIYLDSRGTGSAVKDVQSGRLIATPWLFLRAAGTAQTLSLGHHGFTDPCLLLCPNTASFAAEDTFEVNQLDTGTASGGTITANTYQSLGKSWTTNEFAGYAFVITAGGSALGQIRRIVSNTSDTLTISQNFATNPVNTDTFVIAEKAYRAFPTWTTAYFLLAQEALS